MIRVLHEQSFVDDPTRLLRAARYAARLDLALELETERLALAAVEDGALLTISGPRVRHELLLLLAETDPGKAVERLAALDIPKALHPELDPDPELVAGAELGAMETDADRVLAGLAAMVSADPLSLGTWLERLQLPAPERDRIARAAGRGPAGGHRAAPARPAARRPSWPGCWRASRPRRWPWRWPWARRRRRSWSGPATCATSGWRSPATTCCAPACPSPPPSGGRWRARWPASSTARSAAASRSWRPRWRSPG